MTSLDFKDFRCFILRHLDLSRNFISDYGAQLFSKCLNTNCSLQYLNLSSNSLHGTNLESFFFALQENHSLLELGLGYCQLVDPDITYIAKCLQVNFFFYL